MTPKNRSRHTAQAKRGQANAERQEPAHPKAPLLHQGEGKLRPYVGSSGASVPERMSLQSIALRSVPSLEKRILRNLAFPLTIPFTDSFRP